jgi:hypothetical protein
MIHHARYQARCKEDGWVQGTWRRKAGSGQQCTCDEQRGVGEEDGVLATAQLVIGGVVLEHGAGRVVGDVL